MTASLTYPATNRGDQIDEFHGTKVADPYRWLEDANSAETAAWVEAQNAVTMPFLAALPARERMKTRLTELWNYEKRGVPFRRGKRHFFYLNTGLQNQSVLYTTSGPKVKKARVLLDPNTLSTDGTVALSAISFSPNGELMAYAVSYSGSDWLEWRVKNVATGVDLPDVINWSKFSGASWTKDNKGFFYSRYAEPAKDGKNQDTNYFQKLYYHVVGTDQAQDVLIYERPDKKEWGFSGSVTEDGRYLIISVWQGGSKNRVFYKDLKSPEKVVELLPEADATWSFIDNSGSLFWFQTDKNAPRGRIVTIDISAEQPAPVELIAEATETLEGVSMLDNKFVLTYLKDAHAQVKIYDRNGKFLREVALPGLGTVSGFDGSRRSRVTYYTYASFNTPGQQYRFDVRTGVSQLHNSVPVKFEPSDYQTEQIFYTSKDGTRVPMFISYKKGLVKDGTAPTYLYGYGGFNVNLTPSFSPSVLAWMEAGGVYAMPNLRGGGEYGQQWHEAGTKLKKQNVFDDFISAAEWLTANKYTSSSRLSIGGGSNGGLLVGACMTQRPELYAAAVPAVGVMDMLRFHKFTIGWAWIPDYGSAENAEEFKALYAYSPLHNLRSGVSYPATLVLTADHDDRVVPAHSFKFIAELQHAHSGANPVLIRIETKAGHGSGKPTAKVIEEAADKWAFLMKVFGMA